MTSQPASRGGLKLAAALTRFGLSPVLRGARAIDVGASTGGFTDVMLDGGAAHVTAVDVGKGQLVARLREDARVTSLEQTDFKTLTLHVAPGPFDFFAVDVSFVAARSMLRGLAFRLRPNAIGVVLVKPQFELPVHKVKGGDVSAPGLRAQALATFRKKAERLGFELVEAIDSPVAGGEGTVEILAHLKFRGRTAALPAAPGTEDDRDESPSGGAQMREPDGPSGGAPRREPARAAAPAAKAQARAKRLVGTLHWFAVAAPGLEDVVRAEVTTLPGVRAVAAVPGGVQFEGDLRVGMAANLHLRVATRIVVRVGTVRAREFSKLRRLVEKLPWGNFVPPALPLSLQVSASGSRLYHTGAIAETVAMGMSDRLGKKLTMAPKQVPGEEASDDEGDSTPVTRVLVRGSKDEWTFSVDASGELLHRRGWRTEAGRAPLRETLAAGMLALAGYDPSRPLVDPMCGAGTIPIEAAARAIGLAPGLGRSFAFERWPTFEAEAWATLKGEAEAARRPTATAAIDGLDRDAAVIEVARRNAERAGVGAIVRFAQARFGERAPDRDALPTDRGAPGGPGPAAEARATEREAVLTPAGPGLVLMNPPYGRRLGERGGAGRLMRELGRTLRARYPGWSAGVLVAEPGVEKALGLPVRAIHPLRNGGLRVQLLLFDVPG